MYNLEIYKYNNIINNSLYVNKFEFFTKAFFFQRVFENQPDDQHRVRGFNVQEKLQD